MYAQQEVSSNQQSTDASVSNASSSGTCEDMLSSVGTSEQDLTGNQAAVADAGLDDSSADDGTLQSALETMGTVVLDALPLIASLMLARKFLHISAVRDWVDALDIRQVGAELQQGANDMLSGLWPVGTGFVVDGALGGEIGLGADLDGTATLVRTGADDMEGHFEESVAIGLLSAGAGAMLKDAFGDEAAGLMSQLSLTVVCTGTGELQTSFDLGSLLSSGGLLMAQELSTALGPAAAVAVPATHMLDNAAGDPWDLTYEANLVDAVSAGAAVALENVTAPVLDTVIRALGDSAVAGPIYSALAKLEGSGQVGLQFGDAGLGIHGTGAVSLIGAIAAQLPLINDIPGLPDLDALAQQLDLSGQLGADLEFFISLLPDGQTFIADAEGSWIRSSGHSTATNSDTGATAQVTDSITMSFADFASGLKSTDSDGLASFLSGASTAVSRQISIPLDDDAIEQHFPNWQELVSDRLGIPFGDALQVKSEMAIEGSMTASGDSLAQLASAGITPPADYSAGAAINAIGSTLIALGSGGKIRYNWLLPWQDALQSAASSVSIDQAHAVGSLRVGAGGAASVDIEAGGSAEGRVNAGVAVDTPLNDTEVEELGAAMRQT